MSVTSTADHRCQKCNLPCGFQTFYVGGRRLCGYCYQMFLAMTNQRPGAGQAQEGAGDA